ncbi:MAG: GNAT family N-acetyltransferase [Lachnospiraceae bacterium]|nr:GNAT family N-acetyltransferase [Lachnospiraceae bacterium]
MEFTKIDRTNLRFFTPFLPADAEKRTDSVIVGMIEEDTPCAAAVVRLTDDMADITWLFTAPEYRRLGAAHELIEEMRDLISGTRIKGISVSYYENSDGLGEFFEAEGFRTIQGDPVYAMKMSTLMEMPLTKRLMQLNPKQEANPIAHLMRKEKNMLQAFLYQSTGSADFLKKNDDNLSVCAFDQTNPVGVIVTDVLGEDMLSIDLVYNSSAPVFMAALIKRFSKELTDASRMDDTIYFLTINEKIDLFLHALSEGNEEFLPSITLHRAVWTEE